MVAGHYHFSLVDLMDRPVSIVVLREPIQRTISNMKHLIRHGNQTRESVMQSLDDGRLPVEDNLMTRYLGGAVDHNRFGKSLNPREFLDRLIDDGQELLESATRRLTQVTHLGVAESMDELLSSLREGGLQVEDLNRHNADPDPSFPLSGRQMSTVRAHNELDIQLYSAATAEIHRRRHLRPRGV